MARLVILVMVLVAGAASHAWADEADELVGQGNELAKNHDFAPAIEKFKAADRLRARAQNTCMIGLAYLRRQHLAQAEVYLGRCRSLATASDPAPDWLDDAESQLSTELAAADVAPIEIRVAAPGAKIALSSFAIDESFAPRTVHLAAGSHAITASAPGFASQTKEISVVARAGQTVEIELVPAAPVVPPPAVVAPVVTRPLEPAPPSPPPVSRSAWPNRLFIIGGGAAVGAVVLHALAVHTRKALANPTSADSYHAHEGTFDLERAGALSLYGVAAVAIGAGLYLRLSHRDRGAQIGATYTGAGGLVTIGWTR